MKLIRVAAATLNQTPLDWDRNQANIVAAIAGAKELGASILCLPELCITGYGCEDAFLSPNTLAMAERVLFELAPETKGLIACFGLPIRYNKALFNACALVADGEVRGFAAKRALAGDGLHYEPRWFKPWPRGQRVELELEGAPRARSFPLGDVHFDCAGVKIGFEICEDAWVAKRPGAELALDAVDVILNPSASHFAFGKHEVRRRLVLEGSRAFGVSYVYANLVGNEAGRAIYDGDALIATGGRIVAENHRFSFRDVNLVSAVVDIELTRAQYGRLTSFEPHVESSSIGAVRVPFAFPRVEPVRESAALDLNGAVPGAPWETSANHKQEEFARAIALGLFDYMRKSRSSGFVISLSGGADSAAVACLSRLMLDLSVEELGFQAVLDRFGDIAAARGAKTVEELAQRLITTVYQATRNSGDITRNAARDVAHAVGSSHVELEVDALVASYEALAEKALGRKLNWEEDDLALQNVQARVRAPSVWLLANVKGALLLSTSNRSEAAVGYATMDGDTAGGLSPIAGIDKAFLRRWLEWLETSGPGGKHALPALHAVTVQAPTAELRPPKASQTDEADLMPYDVLDAIERAAIRDKRSPVEAYQLLRAVFSAYSSAQLGLWVERFFLLWSRNQWKRERYAPSFHVDDANLDPKTWCRFPILSGGFARELTELRAVVAADR
jgi:NAD+ synthase (glutamine-hydrolysing)